jgi:opacity protein-like surface antigen
MRNRFASIVLLALLAVVFVPVGSSAQQWNLNVYGGWSYANLTGGSAKMLGGDYTSGFAGGVGGELKLNEDWGWEFGLWYVQKGTKGQFSTDTEGNSFLPVSNATFDGTVSLDYVEVPILVNMYFPVGDKANIRGFIGPAIAFRTKATADGDLNGGSGKINLQDAIDDADITVMIGAGGQFELDRINLMLDFRWDIGATNISNIEGTTLRNNTVMITAAIGIPLATLD